MGRFSVCCICGGGRRGWDIKNGRNRDLLLLKAAISTSTLERYSGNESE